jgi:hypothetical protein
MQVFHRVGMTGVALMLSFACAAPAGADGMAVIETAAQLHEYSNEGVTTAVLTAVETAARGAKAMGFTQITIKGVRVLPQMVVVQVIASDSSSGVAPDDQDQDEQPRPSTKSGRTEL